MGWTKPVPLLLPPVEAEPEPEDVEDGEVPAVLEDPDSESEPPVDEEPEEVWVLVPFGTVLLPFDPAPVVPLPEDTPPVLPVGAADPPPTTEETRVVPLTAAGMPCGPAGIVAATAVLVRMAEG